MWKWKPGAELRDYGAYLSFGIHRQAVWPEEYRVCPQLPQGFGESVDRPCKTNFPVGKEMKNLLR